MSNIPSIPQQTTAIHPPIPYRDQLGLAHEGLSHTAALQIRNSNLSELLTEALQRNADLEQRIRELEGGGR